MLFDDPALKELPLVFCHNDLNSTNFLQDEQGKYHLIDWEAAGLNYQGYELANFFNEMTWDYTITERPFFKILDSNGLTPDEMHRFL